MAYESQGKAVVFGTSEASATPPSFTLYAPGGTSVAGYVTPITNGASITHQAASEMIANEAGEIAANLGHGEHIECSFDLIPAGSSDANAKTSATIPALGSTMVTTGLKIIPAGPFTDALNVAASGGLPAQARWIYMGGGSVRLSSEGHATLSLPMKRFPAITGGTALTN